MTRVLVLGAGGMAGHVVSLYLGESGYEVDTLTATTPLDEHTKIVNVQDQAALVAALDAEKYDAVINCIGLLVKESEARKDLAAYLNGFLPHFLEHHFENTSTRVIHLSTDCVFSGKCPPYKEDSTYDGELFYDRSKALGEVINDKDLTFRQSIIGPDIKPHGTGLYNWFAQQSGDISGYTKSIWNGITTIELAKAIKAALEQELTGLYQLVPETNISKYDLLLLMRDVFERDDLKISAVSGIAHDKTLVNTRKDFVFTVSDYPTMIREMKTWIESHRSVYAHYYRNK